MLSFLSTIVPCAGHEHLTTDVPGYVMRKLASHDIVFMGTTHRQPAIINLMVEMAPRFQSAGVTHLALEISSDQQVSLDRFLATGSGMHRIKLHAAIDCPAYRQFLGALHCIHPDRRPRVMAIDMPQAHYNGGMSRDEYMAGSLAAIIRSRPGSKILVMLGSLHVLRKLQWRPRLSGGRQAVRNYLSKWRADLNMFSMVHIVDDAAGTCDFSRRLGPLPGMVALDVDPAFNGWRLGITSCMAIRPSQPFELVDGVIVH